MTVARRGKQGATVLRQSFMAAYGAEGLNLTGHSRGAMTIGNAMKSLAKDSGSSGILTNTRLKFVGPAYNAQEAANLLGWLSNGTSTVPSGRCTRVSSSPGSPGQRSTNGSAR